MELDLNRQMEYRMECENNNQMIEEDELLNEVNEDKLRVQYGVMTMEEMCIVANK